jgi:hypothetical protein
MISNNQYVMWANRNDKVNIFDLNLMKLVGESRKSYSDF